MSAMSDYLENAFLSHFCSVSSTASPAAVYLGLSTASMNDDNSGTELSGSGYARQAITFASAASASISNNAAVEFPSATGSWGTVSHWAIYDASTGGNQLFHGSFATGKTIATGDILKVASGALTITAA